MAPEGSKKLHSLGRYRVNGVVLGHPAIKIRGRQRLLVRPLNEQNFSTLHDLFFMLDSLIYKCHKLTRVRAKICVSEKFSSIFLMLEYYLNSLINKCHKLTRVRAKICVSEKFSSIFLMLEYYLNSLINKCHKLIRVRTKICIWILICVCFNRSHRRVY